MSEESVIDFQQRQRFVIHNVQAGFWPNASQSRRVQIRGLKLTTRLLFPKVTLRGVTFFSPTQVRLYPFFRSLMAEKQWGM
jgi:hypothetical protein